MAARSVRSTIVEDRAANLSGALLERRYRVEALLARGGMSAVYRGLDTRLDRPVAIKVMDPRFADDRTFVDRFEREARSAAKIHHPNVVAVHDQGLDGGHVYLVMELVNGGTLRDLISERGALAPPLALSIMEPVLSALAAAHHAGLIHRDVKPENVLIGEGGVVKVADFGLVRAVASAGTTNSSVILGTVAYLSPEQVTTGAATARGDVYSAGIVLYETLTGTSPYTGDNALSIAYRHVNDDVPAPSAAVPGIPPPLDELVTRATRRDPATRPIDGGAFLLDLQQVRTTLALPRVPVPVPDPTHVDRTVPVPAEVRAGAPAQDPPGGEGSTSGVLDPDETIETIETGERGLLAPAPAGTATVVRKLPVGFQASGPRGTRAMLRTDLDLGAPEAGHPGAGAAVPLGAIPVGAVPVGPAPPTGPPSGGLSRQSGPRPAPPPWSRGRRIALWSVIGALVLALLVTTTWWFTSGRWTSVPTVAGQDSASAERALSDADLHPNIKTVRHNDVGAGKVIRTEPAGGERALRGDQVTLVVSAGRPTVPDVAEGISAEDAESAIRAVELQPYRDDGANRYHDTVPKGAVVTLDPKPGTQLNIGSAVTIVLSKGPEPKPVPDVRGKTRDEAFQALREAGYEPFDGPSEFSPDVDGGRVIRTDPAADTKVEDGQSKRVGVIVSTAVTVPDVLNRPVPDAQRILGEAGLTLELAPLSNPNGLVRIQDPAPGSRLEKGNKVATFAL